MNFDFKSLLNLNNLIGKKLITYFYYASIIAVAIGVLVMFIGGIGCIATGKILSGLGCIIFCVPLGVFLLIVLRLVCEFLTVIYDHCEKE